MYLKLTLCQLVLCVGKALPEDGPEIVKNKVKLPNWAIHVGSANKLSDPKKVGGQFADHDTLEPENDGEQDVSGKQKRQVNDADMPKRAAEENAFEENDNAGNDDALPPLLLNETAEGQEVNNNTDGAEEEQEINEDENNGGEIANQEEKENKQRHSDLEMEKGGEDIDDDMFGFRIPFMDDENDGYSGESDSESEEDDDGKNN